MLTDCQLRDELEKLDHVSLVLMQRRGQIGTRVVAGVELANGRGVFHRDGLPAKEFLDEVKARAPK